MLDREIQIMADLRLFLHDSYKVIRNLLRIAVQNADPADPADLTELLQKDVKGFFPVQVFSVQGGFLGHQDQFLYP